MKIETCRDPECEEELTDISLFRMGDVAEFIFDDIGKAGSGPIIGALETCAVGHQWYAPVEGPLTEEGDYVVD